MDVWKSRDANYPAGSPAWLAGHILLRTAPSALILYTKRSAFEESRVRLTHRLGLITSLTTLCFRDLLDVSVFCCYAQSEVEQRSSSVYNIFVSSQTPVANPSYLSAVPLGICVHPTCTPLVVSLAV